MTHTWYNGEIPLRMRQLPLCPDTHFPIPAFCWQDDDGTPHFDVVDEEKAKKLIDGNLCWICELPLGPIKSVIGNETSIQSGIFTDGAMHWDCANFAMQSCPFLSNPRRGYKDGRIYDTPSRIIRVRVVIPTPEYYIQVDEVIE